MKSKMYRIKNQDSMIGGVCLGLAEHFRVDVTLLRAMFVVLFFTPLPIGITYIILWILLPKRYGYLTVAEQIEKNNLNGNSEMSNQTRNGNMVGGLILIALGAIFSFKTFFDINLFSYLKNMWPIVLIALGVWIIVKEKDDNGPTNNGNHNNNYGNPGNSYGGSSGSGTSF